MQSMCILKYGECIKHLVQSCGPSLCSDGCSDQLGMNITSDKMTHLSCLSLAFCPRVLYPLRFWAKLVMYKPGAIPDQQGIGIVKWAFPFPIPERNSEAHPVLLQWGLGSTEPQLPLLLQASPKNAPLEWLPSFPVLLLPIAMPTLLY